MWESLRSLNILLSFPLGMYPEVELLDHMVDLFLIFWGTSILLSIVLHQLIFPVTTHENSLFSTSLPKLIFYLLDDSHCNRSEVLSHCGFNLYFSGHYWCWASFPISVVPSCIWNVFAGLMRSPHQMYGLQIFFPFCRLSLHFVDDVFFCAETL